MFLAFGFFSETSLALQTKMAQDIVVMDILATQFQGANAVIQLCQRLRLIPTVAPTCNNCGSMMALGGDSTGIDGFTWRCNGTIHIPAGNKKAAKSTRCTRRVSIRIGTIFEGSHLSLATILMMINLWCDGMTLKAIMHQCRIKSKETMNEWAKKLRSILLDRLVFNVSFLFIFFLTAHFRPLKLVEKVMSSRLMNPSLERESIIVDDVLMAFGSSAELTSRLVRLLWCQWINGALST